ncbi:MAG: CRISPR-associated protein Cas4 [Saprospiraceae bacterium]|nr:CRISPR-associated protein Cas4 [Saprospiraceae bacterium]MDW8484877.1 CRISPR-associated protein Cas4 [Saprospiraceae bacterium]
MSITGTQVAYYIVCPRKLWLFTHHINFEQTSELVADGRFISESTYERRADRYVQLEIECVKIDFYDAAEGVVHETKRSNKMEPAHIAQIKYYMYLLEKHGIPVHYGILEYPKQRLTHRVDLTDEDRQAIPRWLAEIEQIVSSPSCPAAIQEPFCKQCAYFDFCYADEEPLQAAVPQVENTVGQ